MIGEYNRFIARRQVPTKLSHGKQMIYRFNGDPKYDETVSDTDGVLPLRRVGEIVRNSGKNWRVTIVRDDFNMLASRTAVQIHHVFLTDKI
jgi:hypothetical protein